MLFCVPSWEWVAVSCERSQYEEALTDECTGFVPIQSRSLAQSRDLDEAHGFDRRDHRYGAPYDGSGSTPEFQCRQNATRTRLA